MNHIVSTHGRAKLSKVSQGGEHVGYCITCRNPTHVNADDLDEVFCKKTLMLGVAANRLTDEECKRRLKMWFLLGNDPATPTLESEQGRWKPGEFRTGHRNYGGPRLRELAGDLLGGFSGYTDEELDDACARVG